VFAARPIVRSEEHPDSRLKVDHVGPLSLTLIREVLRRVDRRDAATVKNLVGRDVVVNRHCNSRLARNAASLGARVGVAETTASTTQWNQIGTVRGVPSNQV
jgi:hypothetical protein